MKQRQFLNILLVAAIVLCSSHIIWGQDSRAPEVPGENVILQWNRIIRETLATPGQQPPTVYGGRSYAIMHAAMFDAVNSIDGRYTPYWTEVPGSPRASHEAAAAKAARDVLVALFPTRQAIFDNELANSLTGIKEDRAKEGVRIGEIVAFRILALRASDGWNVTPPALVLPNTPGNWQPTPTANAAATFTHFPAVLPFATASSSQFLSNAPPALTSAQYAADLNEIKEIGSATSTTRTADQTAVARLWDNVGTPTNFAQVWYNVARQTAISRNNTTAENARFFALLAIAHHDALQSTFASKYTYVLWRPVTAIRRADEDGNPSTAQEVNWTPLLTTKSHPVYAGDVAAVGFSQSTILALFFGRDDIPFQHTWEGSGGATRSYSGFTAMAEEQAKARVYGGTDFTFANIAGQAAGRNVANYVFLNFMKPRCDR
ncbi:MAG: vanadium-dependent haloperoxidase [Pyrinomonadaceae bacterium]